MVRTFFDGVFTWTTGNYSGHRFGHGWHASTAVRSGPQRCGHPALVGSNGSGSVNGTDGNTSAGSLGVYYAFIQFAGFTMGKAVSQFDAPWTNYPGNITDNLVGGSAHRYRRHPVHATRPTSARASRAAFSAEDATQYYQAGNLEHDRRDRGWHDRWLVRHQRHRRLAFAEPRGYGACRPGLGPLPGVGGCA